MTIKNLGRENMMVLAYRRTTKHGSHVDSLYRSEQRANEQAKGSEKDKVGGKRLYELCQMRLVQVRNAEWQVWVERSTMGCVKREERRKGDIREKSAMKWALRVSDSLCAQGEISYCFDPHP
jgi:hypothetical protein